MKRLLIILALVPSAVFGVANPSTSVTNNPNTNQINQNLYFGSGTTLGIDGGALTVSGSSSAFAASLTVNTLNGQVPGQQALISVLDQAAYRPVNIGFFGTSIEKRPDTSTGVRAWLDGLVATFGNAGGTITGSDFSSLNTESYGLYNTYNGSPLNGWAKSMNVGSPGTYRLVGNPNSSPITFTVTDCSQIIVHTDLEPSGSVFCGNGGAFSVTIDGATTYPLTSATTGGQVWNVQTPITLGPVPGFHVITFNPPTSGLAYLDGFDALSGRPGIFISDGSLGGSSINNILSPQQEGTQGTTVAATSTASWASGSSTVTVGSTTGMQSGFAIATTGSGMPVNDQVLAVVDGTHITLTAPTYAAGSDSTFTADNYTPVPIPPATSYKGVDSYMAAVGLISYDVIIEAWVVNDVDSGGFANWQPAVAQILALRQAQQKVTVFVIEPGGYNLPSTSPYYTNWVAAVTYLHSLVGQPYVVVLDWNASLQPPVSTDTSLADWQAWAYPIYTNLSGITAISPAESYTGEWIHPASSIACADEEALFENLFPVTPLGICGNAASSNPHTLDYAQAFATDPAGENTPGALVNLVDGASTAFTGQVLGNSVNLISWPKAAETLYTSTTEPNYLFAQELGIAQAGTALQGPILTLAATAATGSQTLIGFITGSGSIGAGMQLCSTGTGGTINAVTGVLPGALVTAAGTNSVSLSAPLSAAIPNGTVIQFTAGGSDAFGPYQTYWPTSFAPTISSCTGKQVTVTMLVGTAAPGTNTGGTAAGVFSLGLTEAGTYLSLSAADGVSAAGGSYGGTNLTKRPVWVHETGVATGNNPIVLPAGKIYAIFETETAVPVITTNPTASYPSTVGLALANTWTGTNAFSAAVSATAGLTANALTVSGAATLPTLSGNYLTLGPGTLATGQLSAGLLFAPTSSLNQGLSWTDPTTSKGWNLYEAASGGSNSMVLQYNNAGTTTNVWTYNTSGATLFAGPYLDITATGTSPTLYVLGTEAICHEVGTGTSPTVTSTGSGLGTGGTASVSLASDGGFTLNVTTGSSPSAASTICTVTFGQAYGASPNFSHPAAENQASAAVETSIWAATSTTYYVLVGTLSASTTYKWSIQVGH